MKRPTPVYAVLNEAIRMPGVPQLIVTRGFALLWLRSHGHFDGPGFGSLDYAVMSKPTVPDALTDHETRDSFLAIVAQDMAA